ncbi:MAG: glycoside hydrolase family 15 protein [Saprospiraceae bacterium]
MNYPDRYLPIEDYGLIGNLHTCALVSIRGAIDYMCLPRFDSPTVFGRIHDADLGGYFGIDGEDRGAVFKQLYLPGTAILLTRYLAEKGMAEITDFMPVVSDKQNFAVFRQVKSIRGSHSFQITCAPRYHYGKYAANVEKHAHGYRFSDPQGKEPALLLMTEFDLKMDNGTVCGEITLAEQKHTCFILTLDEKGIDFKPDFNTCFQACRSYWHKWSDRCKYTGAWRDNVKRSALTLKLLTSVRFGSTIAAATHGLPEEIGGERNWDYRYTWIRDAAFTMYAFLRLGYREEAEHFIEWIKDKALQGDLQLLYAVDGERELPESNLDHLEGYRKSSPVRIGNAAYSQTQMDIYGELIDTIYLFNKSGGSITQELWKSISAMVEFVIKNWQKHDHGIWEVRDEKRQFLHSTVCCWVAIDRAIKIALDRSLPAELSRWRQERDKIYNDIYDGFWNEELQSYVQYKGADVLDASALLMPLLRFVSSKEPRWQKTFAKIEEKLAVDVLVFRYKVENGATDGLMGEEGAFTICSFWYVECLARLGRLDDATLAFEKLIGYANHLGLMSEEIGMHGEQLGNFPQAFSHLSMISAAFQIDKRLGGGEG